MSESDTMAQAVLSLHAIQPDDAARVGGKALSLARLMQAGFPVPPGVCITTGAFFAALADYQTSLHRILAAHDLTDSTGCEQASGQILHHLADLRVPEHVVAALSEHEFSGLLAVRSSATSEDGANSSYAGQYTTVLGVQGKAALHDAIVTCWKSFYAANALHMRAERGVIGADEGMAVIVQVLIDAEYSGVCFSVDPVWRRRDIILMNAAPGQGTGVVDGSVASDTYRIERRSFEVHQRQIAVKSERVRVSAAGTSIEAVPEALQNVACLPDSWAQQIARFGLAAELAFDYPQDVEWAIHGGQVWILQSRPLTALPAELVTAPFPVNEAQRRGLWQLETDDGRPVLPLEQAHISLQESMREETCRFMGAARNREKVFINGRAYGRSIPLNILPGDFRIRRQALVDLGYRLHQQGQTSWDYYGPEIVRATERLRAFNPAGAHGEALAIHLEDAMAARRRHYMLHPMCWFHPHPAFFALVETFTGLTGSAAESAGYALLEGLENPLTQLVDALYELAQLARAKPDMRALIQHPPHNVMEQLENSPRAAEFIARLKALLAVYGDRTGDGYGSEATIATPAWREQPEQVLQLVAPYLRPDAISPADARTRARAASDARFQALCQNYHNADTVAEFEREREYARRCVAVLEIHNHYIDQMATGQLRQAVMYAAHWLVSQGWMAQADDVLWLDFDEILAALRASEPGSYRDKVTARQNQHQAWLALDAPPFVGIPDAVLSPRPPESAIAIESEVEREGVLRGMGASPGIYRGLACVVSGDIEALPEIVPGTVLVAENIGPRWTPLFPLLGALVLDGGAVGQHAAAIAREYGVPAVIGTRKATQVIQSNTPVSVNGTTGEVEYEHI